MPPPASSACIVCLLVFLLSSIVLTGDYQAAVSTYHLNRTIHHREVLQTDHVWQLGRNMIVDRPPNVMNVLVRGVIGDLTESIKVERQSVDFPESYEQSPIVPLFPSVDFAFIAGIILSLLALAFSYNAVSGEQELGILKLVISYSVPRDLLLLGKWVGGYLALIAPFVVSFLVGLLISILYPQVEIGADQVLSVLGLLLLALLFLSAVYTLGILVSCRTRMTSTTITVLLLLWVLFILAIPAMAPYVTGQVIRLPSQESVKREKQAIRKEYMVKHEEMMKAEQERTGEREVWQNEEFREKMEAVREEMEATMQKVDDDYEAQVQQQMGWSGMVARLSPLTSFHLAALDLAAAGIEQERRFVKSVNTYAETFQAYAEEKQKPLMELYEKAHKEGRQVSRAEQEKLTQVDASDYPRFSFQYMSFRECLELVYADILLLGLWNVVLFLGAYVSFLRYDVN